MEWFKEENQRLKKVKTAFKQNKSNLWYILKGKNSNGT